MKLGLCIWDCLTVDIRGTADFGDSASFFWEFKLYSNHIILDWLVLCLFTCPPPRVSWPHVLGMCRNMCFNILGGGLHHDDRVQQHYLSTLLGLIPQTHPTHVEENLREVLCSHPSWIHVFNVWVCVTLWVQAVYIQVIDKWCRSMTGDYTSNICA